VSSVVASLTLEGSTQQTFFLCDFIQSLLSFILQSFELHADFRQLRFDLVSVLFSLIQMTAPCVIVRACLVNLQFVRNAFYFDLPLFLSDIGLNYCVSSHISLHLFSHIVMNSSCYTEINFLINLVITVCTLNFIC
jgi:hypothetical protein